MARIVISGLTADERDAIKGACAGRGEYVKDVGKRLFLAYVESSWQNERQSVVQLLRTECSHFGDNDWQTDLHLADVIDKHLLRYVYRMESALELIKEDTP